MLSYEIKKGRSRARQAVRRPPYCPSGWPAGQQLIAILHYLVDIKYLFRGENEHNAMGEEEGEAAEIHVVYWRFKTQNIAANYLEFCLWNLFKCLKNRARIDVSCSGLTGQTKQILHGTRISNFSSEL